MGLEMLVPLMNEALLMRPMLSQRFYRLLLYFCEMYPETVGQMSGNLLRDIVSCLRAALDSLFGEEVTGTAVETIAQMATFFAQQQQGDPTTIIAMSHIVALIQPLFATCLTCSCQVDVFGEATAALYAAICCDREMNTDKHPVVFGGMVDSILQRHGEESTRNQLTIAFARLLPDLQMDATRKEKRIFRDRFETFLNDTQGLLCL